MGVSVFASGSRPDRCPDGHEWGPGRIIVGWMPCAECEGGRRNHNGHHWIRCWPPEGRCRWEWRDPPHTEPPPPA